MEKYYSYVKNGRGQSDKGQNFASDPYIIDYITINEPFTQLTKDRLHQKYIVERLSATKIADEFGVSKTTIKKFLRKYDLKKGMGAGRHWNKLAYGEKLQKGKAIEHKVELQLIESIRKMYVDEGLGVTAIARILSTMKVPTKKQGKKWDHSVVTDILVRAGVYKQTRDGRRKK